MVVAHQSFLSQVFERCREIERQTVEVLGEEDADVFVNIWNDSLQFENAIDQIYGHDEWTQSLVAVRLWEFSRELVNLQTLFLCGNYSLLRSRLRFIWEMIFRGFYADTYEKKSPKDPDKPGPSIDDKSVWLENLEEDRGLGWGKLIKPTLCRVCPLAEKEAKVLDYYHKLWTDLNKYVHPTHFLVETMIDRDVILIDRFSEEWARETVTVATDVFDLIWLAVIARFPGCLEIVAKQDLIVQYPRTKEILKQVPAG
jgi:hypothetical protein